MQRMNYSQEMENNWRIRLEQAIEKSGKSKSFISEMAGYDKSYLRDIFNHKKVTPTVDKLIDVCKVLGISPAVLFTDAESERLLNSFSALSESNKKRFLDFLDFKDSDTA